MTASHVVRRDRERTGSRGGRGAGGTIGRLVLTSVSVVVILGAIIAAIAWAVLADDGQPATADREAGTGPAVPGSPEVDRTPSAEIRGEPPPDEVGAPIETTAVPGSALGVQAAGLLAALAPEPAEETILVPEADVRVASRPSATGGSPASGWQRARAVMLLALMIAALGAAGAAALGLLVVGGAAFFDQALG